MRLFSTFCGLAMQHLLHSTQHLRRHWPLLLRAAFKRAGEPQDFWLTLPWHDCMPDTLARYRQMFGFSPSYRPLTSYYLPIQRAQLYCMLQPHFGFSPIGLIHTRNQMVLHAPIASTPLQLSTSVQLVQDPNRSAMICRFASYLHPAQPHFPSEPSALTDIFLSCQSDYLLSSTRQSSSRQAHTGQATAIQVTENAQQLSAPPSSAAITDWFVAPHSGRDYARLSGDLNPIHLYDWSARLCGLRRAIIHGMHSVAMIEAQLQSTALSALEVHFKKPLPLGHWAHLQRVDANQVMLWQAEQLVLTLEHC